MVIAIALNIALTIPMQMNLFISVRDLPNPIAKDASFIPPISFDLIHNNEVNFRVMILVQATDSKDAKAS